MMKRILTPLILLSGLAFSACSSLNTAALRSMNKVAIVSMCANKRVLPPQASVLSVVASESQKDEMQLTQMKDDLYQHVMSYEGNFPFSYVAEEKVIEGNAFKQWKENAGEGGYYESVKGYGNVVPDDTDVLMETFAFLPKETDGIMAVDLTYQYVATSGIGPLQRFRIMASMHMTLHNRAGEEVMRIKKSAYSDESIMAYAGAFDAKDTQKLALEASKNVFAKMDEYIQKKLKK
jgi:hypothetical protein